MTSKCLADWRMDRVTRNPSIGRMPRRTGDHHDMPSTSVIGMGKSPRRYAARTVPGSRSAPTATMSSSASIGSGKIQPVIGGSLGAVTFVIVPSSGASGR